MSTSIGPKVRLGIGSDISVCLLTYNHVNVIASSLESILNQTITGYEIIVSDDCSTDGTWELVLEIASKNKRINPIRTPTNLGMPGNANFAATQSVRPYLALLHHDDLYREDLLEKWHGVMARHPDVGFVFNSYGVYQSSRVDSNQFADERLEGRWLLENHLFPKWGCCVRGTAMVRRIWWNRLGGIREQFGLLGDVDLWMRLSAVTAVGYVAEPIIIVRQARPDYYPEIYHRMSSWWRRMRYLYEIHATNRLAYYDRRSVAGAVRWWVFRSRLSVETAKWLVYAIARRKWTMIETCADSVTVHDQLWLRILRRLLRIAVQRLQIANDAD
jgi:GT2 family glycosyltransferase